MGTRPNKGRSDAHRPDARQLLAQLSVDAPQIPGLQQTQPDIRPIAARFANPDLKRPNGLWKLFLEPERPFRYAGEMHARPVPAPYAPTARAPRPPV